MWWRRDKNEEDPFAALRDGTAGTTTSTGARPQVADHSTITGVPGAADEPATEREPGSRAPKRRRGSDRLLVLLVVLFGLGGSAALIAGQERAADDGQAQAGPSHGGSGDSDPGVTTPARPEDAAAPPPRRQNLVRPAGMRRALAALRRTMRRGEVLDSLRVAPDRVNATVHSPRSERQRTIDIADDLTVRATAAGQRDGGGMRLAQVRADAPWRAARNAARAGGFPVRRLDYLVLSAPIISGTKPTWSLFFDGVRLRNSHWIASLDGRSAYRPGEQPGSGSTTSSTLTVRRNGSTTTYSGAEAERISRCIRAAGTDGAAIQRCLP